MTNISDRTHPGQVYRHRISDKEVTATNVRKLDMLDRFIVVEVGDRRYQEQTFHQIFVLQEPNSLEAAH